MGWLGELTAILWRMRWRGRIWAGWRGRIACFGGRRWRSLGLAIRRRHFQDQGSRQRSRKWIPSTTSRTAYPRTASPSFPLIARSVTTAPPRLWPTSTKPGSSAQPSFSCIKRITSNRSRLRVPKLKFKTPSAHDAPDLSITVSPCPRASRERTPALGRALRMADVNRANERPEEPAPWCVTNRGPLPVGGVI